MMQPLLTSFPFEMDPFAFCVQLSAREPAGACTQKLGIDPIECLEDDLL